MDTVALVVPTIRENCFRDFVQRWGDIDLFRNVHLIVMEDNPEPTFNVEKILEPYWHVYTTHLSWKDIDSDLEDKNWIIPRRSDTVRSYAYYWAWKRKNSNDRPLYDFIMTLDDDCYPTTSDDGIVYSGEAFVQEHIRQFAGRTRWYNTLNSVKPRGVPFYNLGKNDSVIVNHGLWTNVLDYDAPYQLANPIPEKFSFDNRIVPAGQYFPMCGMNVMWKRDVTVLMYHLLMGQQPTRRRSGPGVIDDSFTSVDGIRQPVLNRLPFDRFGDIWCGIFMKKIADLRGQNVSTGMPYIRHERASNPFTNLKKEANGIEVNERLWEYVDSFYPAGAPVVTELTLLYERLGAHITAFDEFPEHKQYFVNLGEAMQVWAGLFRDA